jgi:glycosyltransferase involved in cell wall biosynthesis
MHVSNLAISLTNLGHKCFVIALGNEKKVETVDGVQVTTLPKFLNVGSIFSFPIIGTQKYISEKITNEKIDFVSVHTRFFPMTWLGVDAARKLNCTTLITEHGSGFVKGVSLLKLISSRLIDITKGRNSLRRADKVLAISGNAKHFVHRLAAVDAEVFFNAINVIDWKTSVSLPQSRLVFIGRMVKDKGWKESIEAFNKLAPVMENLELDFFGDGAKLSSAKKLANTSKYKDRIHFHGTQPPEVIRLKLAGSILLNPTLLSEGFQTVLLEAFSAGARIVTFDTPGLYDIQTGGALVWVCKDKKDLVHQIQLALQEKPYFPDMSILLPWDWAQRAKQFVEISTRINDNKII